MTRKEFYNLKVGDYVQITQHGQNKGKIGLITKICDRGLGYGGSIYLTPYNCVFTFSNPRKEVNGAYRFNHESLKCLGKFPIIKSTKKFYMAIMYGADSIDWPTSNFTETELKVIDRFITEVNKHINGRTIDSMAILDNN